MLICPVSFQFSDYNTISTLNLFFSLIITLMQNILAISINHMFNINKLCI